MKIRISPTLRISIGLVFVTLSLVMAARFVGLVPERGAAELESRQRLVEALSMQLTSAASRTDIRLINDTLDAVVKRNDDVLSAGLRDKLGNVIAGSGDHEASWVPQPGGKSTSTHVQVPIFQGKRQWGAVEISFAPLGGGTLLERVRGSPLSLFAFIALAGFGGYFMLLRRALRELDPSGVIPERVKAAFDALAEGVLIMDEDERIVLVNAAFQHGIWQSDKPLTGKKSSELNWRQLKSADAPEELPWQIAIREGQKKIGLPLSVRTVSGEMRTFMVNGSPIMDAKGNVRGALATFDDVTDLEKKNADLQLAMSRLEEAKEEVNRKNRELTYLATRDPLTNCLNRRAYFELMDKAIDNALRGQESLCCMMLNIDHFKAINDKHGHDVGDKVIAYVADIMASSCRETDLICRYGGEEFCITLPGLSIDESVAVAERIRHHVSELSKTRIDSALKVTISVGVAELAAAGGCGKTLVKEADMALYTAKDSGRNRVIRWDAAQMTMSMRRIEAEPESAAGTTGMMVLANGRQDATIPADQRTINVVKILQQRIADLETILEEQALEAHKEHGYDRLTGLPNRLLFFDRVSQSIARAARTGQAVAILYLDVDLFRRVNDAFGPAVGDRLLREVADRISGVLRASDSVAVLGEHADSAGICRLSNDEFAIELADIDAPDTVTWIVRRIFSSLEKPLRVDDNDIYVTCSIGIGVFPGDANDSETLIGNARIARQHARDKLGRNSYAFYASDMNDHSMGQMKLEADLRRAIENNEFILHYQPKLDVSSGEVVSMEALVRWHHPEMGMVPPDSFIPLAEQTGLINPIGQWVLKEACEQTRRWMEAGIGPRCVAVNLSAVQLRTANVTRRILSTIANAGLRTHHIELEITETALMQDIEASSNSLRELHSRGLHLAVDDFGTGYSSLSYLKRFSVDTLKIDRSFVRDIVTNPDDRTVVSAIIAMAHRLGIRVVAEGVETEAQLGYLSTLNCDQVQGYFIARPMAAKDAGDWLRAVHAKGPIPGTSDTSRLPVLSEEDLLSMSD
ncbi:MAG: diguanylate cyclase [Gammaproteobacteria bacterium]|nr:diguanylate cyclase [Gammaproteobacteria bacterium]